MNRRAVLLETRVHITQLRSSSATATHIMLMLHVLSCLLKASIGFLS